MEKLICVNLILESMGRLDVVISDELEDQFRQEVAKEKGMKKGNLSKSIAEAIEIWIESNQKKRSEAAKKAWKTRRNKN